MKRPALSLAPGLATAMKRPALPIASAPAPAAPIKRPALSPSLPNAVIKLVLGACLMVLAAGCFDPIVGYPCRAGFTECAGTCVDLTRSPDNCGQCGHGCAGTDCVASQCVPGTIPGGGADAGPDARSGEIPDARNADGLLALDGPEARGDAVASVDRAPSDGTPADAALPAPDAPGGTPDARGPGPDAPAVVPDAPAADAPAVVPDAPAATPDVASPDDAVAMADAPETPDAEEPDAAPTPDAFLCPMGLFQCGGSCLDGDSDPDNCGSCNNRCSSGLCTGGVCQQQGAGHLVVIGHDYRVTRAGMNHLVGNAVFLASRDPIAVLVYEGTAEAQAITNVDAAMTQISIERGRPWSRATTPATDLVARLPAYDTLLILAQRGSSDAELLQLGMDWGPALSDFLAGGRTVVLLDGASPNNAGTFAIAGAAGLFNAVSRVEVTGTTLTVSSPGDAVALRMPRTYLAETTTVGFTTLDAVQVVTSVLGLPVVVHRTF